MRRPRYRLMRQDSPEAKGMKAISRHVVRHPQALAREIEARVVLVLADAVEEAARNSPELFPPHINLGFRLTGRLPESAKLPGIRLRQSQENSNLEPYVRLQPDPVSA